VTEPMKTSSDIASNLSTNCIGHPILSYENVSSTNDVLKELAVQGAPEGTTVVAQAQSKGRGRRGREWTSVPGRGVYMSVLLHPGIPGTDAGQLAILGGVSVIRALETLELRNLALKWPNDVLAGGRKIAGILIEPRIGAGLIEFAVVGIGINVEQKAEDWTDALKETATSCHMEGVLVSCGHVIRAVLSELDYWYPFLRQRKSERLMAEWVQRGGKVGIPEIE
jgi:BirA family transcriptional regulator, biotin operon repressor / biotin---[acetyl-CoA-carboxylase] ligase